MNPRATSLGQDHLGHSREHNDVESGLKERVEEYMAQLTSVFILEFGLLFQLHLHRSNSGGVGRQIRCAVQSISIVLVFHQIFECLGLGSRLAMVPWPCSKMWAPYIPGVAFGLSTPIEITIGLGVHKSFTPEGYANLINSVSDSISAGILIYTALIESTAHEFTFSTSLLLFSFVPGCFADGAFG